jgi:hypothetical protein
MGLLSSANRLSTIIPQTITLPHGHKGTVHAASITTAHTRMSHGSISNGHRQERRGSTCIIRLKECMRITGKKHASRRATYEGMNAGRNGLGWWQGEEAWNQLMHGGTMESYYGAACLWQWKSTPDEPGWMLGLTHQCRGRML